MDKIVAKECYMCEKFNINENRQRNKLWCFFCCEYYGKEQIRHNCKILEIDIEENK